MHIGWVQLEERVQRKPGKAKASVVATTSSYVLCGMKPTGVSRPLLHFFQILCWHSSSPCSGHAWSKGRLHLTVFLEDFNVILLHWSSETHSQSVSFLVIPLSGASIRSV